MINLRVALVALSMMWTWPIQGMPLEYPLQYKPQVTSTFGTYRITHHHAGLDLTTDGNETVPVVASADGSIVRIRRSHTGYGRVVYVQHGRGRMTVYAHLSGFSPTITGLCPLYHVARRRFLSTIICPSHWPWRKDRCWVGWVRAGLTSFPILNFAFMGASIHLIMD